MPSSRPPLRPLAPLLLGLSCIAVAGAHCGQSAHTSQADLGDAGLCEGTAQAGSTHPAPTSPRIQGTNCAPTWPANTDAAVVPCTSSADCANGGAPFGSSASCIRGQCSLDQCYADSDCRAGTVCVCGPNVGGGNAIHSNMCITARCKSDADCGPGNYCLPSQGYCGGVEGFYCTTGQDSCVDARTDCPCVQSPQFSSCQYAPQVGRWVCGPAICQG